MDDDEHAYDGHADDFRRTLSPDQKHAWAHSVRFRKTSTRYPLRVAEAYEGDVIRALADTDLEVAERVAAWERAQGLETRGWRAIGEQERAEHDDDDV